MFRIMDTLTACTYAKTLAKTLDQQEAEDSKLANKFIDLMATNNVYGTYFGFGTKMSVRAVSLTLLGGNTPLRSQV